MITVICQYTGIPFEAKTTRSKNHPVVSELLNAAAKNGNYSQVKDILEQCKVAGVQDIEAVREAVKAGYVQHIAELNARRRAEAEEKKAREEMRSRRIEQNRFLSEHGYTWHKNDSDGYQPMFDDDSWHLVSPDGRVVSVAQAMDEIKRGREVVLAEIAAKEVAATRQAQLVRSDAGAAEIARLEAKTIAVEPFDYAHFEMVSRHEYGVSVDKIFRGQVNGVDASVIYHYFGGNDYYESVGFYCVDPEAAGLIRAKYSGLQKTLADFWG